MSKLINITNLDGVKLLTKDKYCDDDIQVQIDSSLEYNGEVESGAEVDSDFDKFAENTLTNLKLNTATKITKYRAFYDMESLLTVDLPNVTVLPTNAFYMCKNLETVNITNVTLFPSRVFSGCNKLVNVNIPNATSFGTYVFHECYLLTNINSTENVVSIGDNCFAYCEAIEKIDFPNVETVGTYAFQACDNLTEIKLGNITTINSGTFRNSKKLYDIYLGYEGLVSLSATSAFTNTGNTRGYVNIHVRPGLDLATQYASATNWSSLIEAETIIIVEDYTDD